MVHGKKLLPERIMRRICLPLKDFLQFHQNLDNLVLQYNNWNTPLTTTFSVKGKWTIPKAPLLFAQTTVEELGNYSRWLFPLTNGWVVSCLFTQNVVNDLVLTESELEYAGVCTMDVELATKYL